MNMMRTIERMAPEHLTTAQAADYLNVSAATLATWRSTGHVKLPFVKLGGKHVRYRRSDLEAFVKSNLRGGGV